MEEELTLEGKDVKEDDTGEKSGDEDDELTMVVDPD